MRLFQLPMESVRKYIVKMVVDVSGLKQFMHSGCDNGAERQRLGTYCFLFLFLDSGNVFVLA